MNRAALLIVPIVLAFWACATVPDETAKPEIAPVGEEKKDATPIAATNPADTKAVEIEPEQKAGPIFILSTVSSYLANGVLDTMTKMIYENGLLLEERISYADGSPAGRVTYTYEKGLLAASLKTDSSGKPLSAYGYAYDVAGNLVEETLLDTAGNPIFSYRFAYDLHNRRTELKIVSSDGQVLSYAEYKYSAGKNNRIETFNLLGEMQEFLERTFDGDGRPVLEVVSEVSGFELEKVKLEYSGGLLAAKETYVQTRKTGSVKYQYDGAGNLTVRVRYDRTGKIMETNEYSYIEVKE